jgi:hypothetical protein
MKPSARQIQPRSEFPVESAVKQTMFVCRQGIPRSEIDPGGAIAGTVAVE